MVLGNCGRRLTSRATLGTRTEGITWPKMTSSTSEPARSVRARSSRAAYRARVTAVTSLRTVPLFAKGVRTPATTAGRRPAGIVSILSFSVGVGRAPAGDNACHRAPALHIHRLEHLAAVQHLERGDEPGEFAAREQVFVPSRPPAKFTLGHHERFHNQRPAGSQRLKQSRDASPVKVVEHEHHVERRDVGPVALRGPPTASRRADRAQRPARGRPPTRPRRCPTPSPSAPRAAAARLCRPWPQATSSTRVPGPNR